MVSLMGDGIGPANGNERATAEYSINFREPLSVAMDQIVPVLLWTSRRTYRVPIRSGQSEEKCSRVCGLRELNGDTVRKGA